MSCRKYPLVSAIALVIFLGCVILPSCSSKSTSVETREIGCLSISPSIGPQAGGTDVEIVGSGFKSGADVLFGRAEAASVVVSGGGRVIRCRTPAGAPGLVDVVVWNPDGAGCRLDDAFLYGSAPGIVGVLHTDVNRNCVVDAGDTLDVSFGANVTFTVSDPAQAFQLPVLGDALGAGAQFAGGGMPTDVGMVTIVLGTSPALEPGGGFDPVVLSPGSSSGLDVSAIPGLVIDALNPTVSIPPRFPAGVDVSGFREGPIIWDSTGDEYRGAHFGESLASAGDVNGDGFDDVIVGAPRFAIGGSSSQGKAYLYLGGPGGPSPAPDWTSSGREVKDSEFGTSVASAGDVNGDGYDDVIVGAPEFDTLFPSSASPGIAYVFLGGPSGLEPTAVWDSSGEAQREAGFGHSVASAGDVDGDGYDDVIVGAFEFLTPVGGSKTGRAYLYRGGPGGPSTSPAWTSSGDDQTRARYGDSVSSAGDVNGDGYSDVIVGAPSFDVSPSSSGEGKAYLYLGGPTGLSSIPNWTSSGDGQSGSQFGDTVASAGDVNGDGFSDVIVAAAWYDTVNQLAGKAYVFLGAAAGLSTTPVWTSSGEDQRWAWFGGSAASAGDMNGDGYDEIIVGAPLIQTAVVSPGKVYIYVGGPAGPAATPSWTSLAEEQPVARFGSSVACAGDVNGDGFSEVLGGAPTLDASVREAGRAYLFCVRP